MIRGSNILSLSSAPCEIALSKRILRCKPAEKMRFDIIFLKTFAGFHTKMYTFAFAWLNTRSFSRTQMFFGFVKKFCSHKSRKIDSIPLCPQHVRFGSSLLSLHLVRADKPYISKNSMFFAPKSANVCIGRIPYPPLSKKCPHWTSHPPL